MGCYICKQLRTDYYEEEAGDCWVCMSINIALASAIAGGGWALGVPATLTLVAWGVMMFRIGRVGYLLPSTPKWLPYIDFLLEPLGTTPDEAEALKHMSEPVVEVCNEAYDTDGEQSQCVSDLTDVVALRYRGELDSAEFIAAVGKITGSDPSQLSKRIDGANSDD